MLPDSTNTVQTITDTAQWTMIDIFTVIGVVATIVGAIAGVIAAFYAFWPYHQQRRRKKLIEKEFGSELYLPEDIERSTRYYIRPNCSSVDPGQEAEMRKVKVTVEPLFEMIDKHLAVDSAARHLLLLADSGMGKSSFVLNYYAYNQQRPRKVRNRIAVVPLGIPNADEYIAKIEDKRNTVLFLDAFDEDTKAVEDHRQRLYDLMQSCREFKRVLLTCRTQFFPSDEEIPTETGIARIGPYKGGRKGVYEFWKLYLSPLNDNQVEEYIRKRYSFWRRRERRAIRRIVAKIPLLSVRPMLLAYIPDIVKSEKEIRYTYDLYSAMVDAWLDREEGKLGVEKEPLRKFSEKMAVNIYTKRETRGMERIPREEVIQLAREWQIDMASWKLTGRSLLNRDAVGNCKFSHRSVMEYLVVKRYASGDPDCQNIRWSDQMQKFLWEMMQYFFEKEQSFPVNILEADLSLFQLKLRSKPAQELSTDDVKAMLEKFDYYDRDWNKRGKGIKHYYQVYTSKNDSVVADFKTGLIWQRSGSEESLIYADAKRYVADLNTGKYAGYDDWRLPTLEEAMSLMEKEKLNGRLYLDPVFDEKQPWIWTADYEERDSRAWGVNFNYGDCDFIDFGSGYSVRAVRSGQSSQ